MNALEFNLIEKIRTKKLEEKTHFTYKDKKYTLYKYTYSDGENTSYSIWSEYYSMNVDKITSKYVSLYSYDMMDQRTNYKMSLLEMKF